jgi:hypothetical protein
MVLTKLHSPKRVDRRKISEDCSKAKNDFEKFPKNSPVQISKGKFPKIPQTMGNFDLRNIPQFNFSEAKFPKFSILRRGIGE